jgi:Zn-dependent protease
MDLIIEGLLWYIVFIFSTTFHEAAHAYSSFKLGDSTAYEGGQVTLDPMPHIKREPIGTIVVPIISFLAGGWMIGWASTPYDPEWAMRHPKRSAMMSLAGPLANLFLVIVSVVLIKLGIAFDVFYAPDMIDYTHVTAATSSGIFEQAAMLISIIFSLNLILFIFNLLPLPPLDGSGIAITALGDNLARKYMNVLNNPSFALIGLFVAWRVFGYVFDPVHLFAINLLYPGFEYY